MHCGHRVIHRLNQPEPVEIYECRAEPLESAMLCYIRGDGRDDFRVGEVDFHANLGGQILTCISHWPVHNETSQWKKLVAKNDFAIVPSAWLLRSLIFAPAKVGAIATALIPPSVSDPPSV